MHNDNLIVLLIVRKIKRIKVKKNVVNLPCVYIYIDKSRYKKDRPSPLIQDNKYNKTYVKC